MSADHHGAAESGAASFLGALRSLGFDTLFVNAGTDFSPVIEAYAACPDADAFPEPVLATHENVVVGMAHGAFLATGAPQALMVHVSVGTANTICGVMNAARERVPLLVMAGRSPVLESGAAGARDTAIHWPQEMFDQAAMVRELVKWDYELRRPDQARAVAERAHAIATEEPRGPVYLSLPREALAAAVPTGPASTTPRRALQPSAPSVDAAATAEIAELLAAATHPVIAVTSAGADVTVPGLLEDLASRHGIDIAQVNPRYLNVRWDHPRNVGSLEGLLGRSAPDVLVFVECDVPWIAARAEPPTSATIVQVGLDPLARRYPMRTHRADHVLTGTARSFLVELDQALSRTTASHRERSAPVLPHDASPAGPIEKPVLTSALGRALQPDDVVFNEYWANPDGLRRERPGTYFSLPAAGGLGWALPAALGARRALDDERIVVATVGDGAYLFANPAACHHAAAKHDLPVLTVIANNAVWDAVDSSTRRVYPAGHAVTTGERRFSDLTPSPDYARLCESFGGVGYRVDDAEDLDAVLAEAAHTVRSGRRQVVVEVGCR